MTARMVLLTFLIATAAIAAPPKRVGSALVTFYWLIDETAPRYRGKARAELEDVRGKVIATTSVRFRRDLIREGSGHLRDGRTVAYDRRLHGTNRFRIVQSEYGVGELGCALVPYRTVAVDPHFVKLGTTISIPQLKGSHLPDGTIHDGIFTATDRGHFRGAHVDLFVGLGPKGARPFIRKGYGSRSHVTIYLVANAAPEDCKLKITGHFPVGVFDTASVVPAPDRVEPSRRWLSTPYALQGVPCVRQCGLDVSRLVERLHLRVVQDCQIALESSSARNAAYNWRP